MKTTFMKKTSLAALILAALSCSAMAQNHPAPPQAPTAPPQTPKAPTAKADPAYTPEIPVQAFSQTPVYPIARYAEFFPHVATLICDDTPERSSCMLAGTLSPDSAAPGTTTDSTNMRWLMTVSKTGNPLTILIAPPGTDKNSELRITIADNLAAMIAGHGKSTVLKKLGCSGACAWGNTQEKGQESIFEALTMGKSVSLVTEPGSPNSKAYLFDEKSMPIATKEFMRKVLGKSATTEPSVTKGK